MNSTEPEPNRAMVKCVQVKPFEHWFKEQGHTPFLYLTFIIFSIFII